MPYLYKFVLFLLLGFSLTIAQNYNIDLIGNVNNYSNYGYTDCWGYIAPDGTEYALLGVNFGISIIDVSDTSNIQEADFIPWIQWGWYDIKVYQNYMYVSTEGSMSILIVDLSGLPESASIVGNYTGLTSTPHNIYVDTTQALLYIVEDFHYDPSVRIVSLADPENPVELSTINTAIGGMDVHDLYARDSVLYIAEGGDPSIGFYDVSDPSNPSLITRLNIPAAGYVHQLWVSEDNNYMVTTEETTGRTIKFWDIGDLDNIEMIGEYLAESNLTHNAYIHKGKVFISHYESGLVVLDFTNPFDVVETGRYDTYPQGDGSGFNGAWGVYPFTNSELIYVSDMQTGLYVFEFAQEEGPHIEANDVEFGFREIGVTSDTLFLTIKNNGTEDLLISSISEAESPFHLFDIPELPVGIPSNRSLVLGTTFTPTNGDSAEAIITLSSNDSNDPVIEVVLSGQGVNMNPAQAGIIYGTLGNISENPGSLISINSTSGAGTLIGPTNIIGPGFGAPGIAAVAINSDGNIFVSDIAQNSNIYRIDAASGTPIHITSTGLFVLRDICFDRDDNLYAVDANGNLYTVNISTGVSNLIGSTGVGIRGLAFDPTNGSLWASDNADNIYTIDLSSARSTLIGNTELDNGTTDICFDQIGNLYGAIGASNEKNTLISINKSDGSGTEIGPIGFTAVAGLDIYNETHWMIKIQGIELNDSYFIAGVDSYHVSSIIDNQNAHDLTVKAIVQSYDHSITDTLELFDDGNHSDSLANDGIWGGSGLAKSTSGYFSVDINAYPTSVGYLNNFLYDGARFTTSGPVIFNGYHITSQDTVPNPGDNLIFEINLHNADKVNSVVEISAKTVSLDSFATVIAFSDPLYDEILPDEIGYPSRPIRISFTDDCPVGLPLNFALEISSDNRLFWLDTFTVIVDSTVSSIELTDQIPSAYKLEQNFPNPFNPTTTIGYQLPQRSDVDLSVYNLLGQKVVTLVSTNQQAGSYKVNWDASGQASGIYYYILRTKNGFLESKKLILLK
jgi:choice-of-anchor B domain-containing protein